MGRKDAFERFDLLSLLSDGRCPAMSDGPASLVVRMDPHSRSPLRVSLHGNSDHGFLDTLADELISQGVDEPAAVGVLDEVVNRPGLAARRPGDRRTEILQAVVITDEDGDSRWLVELTASVDGGRPPVVQDSAVDVWPLGDDAERSAVDVAELLEQWWERYALRPSSRPSAAARFLVAVYGDPRHSGVLDAPKGWESSVRRTVAVLGASVAFASGPKQLKGADHLRVPDLGLVLPGDGWKERRERIDGTGGSVADIGVPGMHFSDLLTELRWQIVTGAVDAVWSEPPPADRELAPGEVVYHRKVRSSDRFDTFDEGGSVPCGCGGRYVPWKKAPKAEKGMARRYRNFEPSMLRHCEHYPNCGMYRVEGPRRRGPD